MNAAATPLRPNGPGTHGRNLSLSFFASRPSAAVEEGVLRFQTTDGSMMTYHAGENAVRTGAGIFIGGYFVGPMDEGMLSGHMPFIKY